MLPASVSEATPIPTGLSSLRGAEEGSALLAPLDAVPGRSCPLRGLVQKVADLQELPLPVVPGGGGRAHMT